LGPQLRSAVTDIRSEFIISSPYFIPGKNGITLFRQLRERGVRVRILTNSFAANDVSVVHRGYARYRKDLLKLGVELYEIKPSLVEASEQERKRFGSSGSSLHAKSFVFDRRWLFVALLISGHSISTPSSESWKVRNAEGLHDGSKALSSLRTATAWL
jgi:putative cardiolipin synthase